VVSPLWRSQVLAGRGERSGRAGTPFKARCIEVGFSPNRRLLGVQRLSHNPIRAAEASAAVHQPITTDTGQRIPGLRLGDRRAHALMQALLVFRLLTPTGSNTNQLTPRAASA
jgi:hypothetical protein